MAVARHCLHGVNNNRPESGLEKNRLGEKPAAKDSYRNCGRPIRMDRVATCSFQQKLFFRF
jgi:hypothetical protein